MKRKKCRQRAPRLPFRLSPTPQQRPQSVPPEATNSAVSDSEDAEEEAPATGADDGPPAERERGSESARLRERLSEVYHDLNNSLAVISGNAQLLSELARAEDLGPAFTDPLEDVEAARADISDALERLDRLRAKADRQENRSE